MPRRNVPLGPADETVSLADQRNSAARSAGAVRRRVRQGGQGHRHRAARSPGADRDRREAADEGGGAHEQFEAQGILFVPYFPLASGRLSSYHELTGPAKRLGATSAQVALAWLLCRSPSMVVIPGTNNPDHLRSNVAASGVAENLLALRAAVLVPGYRARRAAALTLGVPRASLNGHLGLEEVAGFALFIHRKRPVKATLRGQLLLDVAQHLLTQVDQAKEPPATA
jgi:hypothetical protein